MLKRGEGAPEVLKWTYRIVFSIAVILSVTFISTGNSVTDLNVRDIESVVIAERMVFEVSQEDVGLTRPGQVDVTSRRTLDDNIVFTVRDHMSGRVSYDDEEWWYHQDTFEAREAIARVGVEGPGGAQVLDWETLALADGEAKVMTTSVVTRNG